MRQLFISISKMLPHYRWHISNGPRTLKRLAQKGTYPLLTLWLALSVGSATHASDLPDLGDTSSRLISLEQEKQLGSAWLRSLRRQVTTYEHPIVEAFFRQTVYNMAPHSQVADRDFKFVMVDSKALNAFAVPGSVIGINTGLFLHAGSEQEFASVIAHELAHISQRHYARRLEKQRLSTPLALAGILTSVIIAATAGSEAGVAALASTQALSAESALSFSRQNEEEADRLGIATMYDSGYDPRAMPIMFERMYRQARMQGNRPPEYLSTHPLSENRISDTRNRAIQYPQAHYQDNIEYHICKSLIINHYAESPTAAADYFRAQSDKGNVAHKIGAKFGLATALIRIDPRTAIRLLDELLEQYPGHISISLTRAQALAEAGEIDSSNEAFTQLYERNPNNYPISILLSEHYMNTQAYLRAEATLTEILRSYKDSPLAWYLLAETYGKLGKIEDVHMARAEYFVLTNRLDSSIEQLKLARSKTKGQTQKQAVIGKRLEEVRLLKKNAPF